VLGQRPHGLGHDFGRGKGRQVSVPLLFMTKTPLIFRNFAKNTMKNGKHNNNSSKNEKLKSGIFAFFIKN
jgi:hypothetical protein